MNIMTLLLGVALCLAQLSFLCDASALGDSKKKLVAELNDETFGQWTAEYNSIFGEMSDQALSAISCSRGSKKNQDHGDAGKPGDKKPRWTCTEQVLFDVRNEWPQCAPVFNKVQDQSFCGSCWAVATASVFSDRYCVDQIKKRAQGRGDPNYDPTSAGAQFSAVELLSCTPHTAGCDGGQPLEAWRYTALSGIVTGTDKDTNSGCKPYTFEKIATLAAQDFFKKVLPNKLSAPKCEQHCTNKNWPVAYAADKKYGGVPQTIDATASPLDSMARIEQQLRMYGSVVASMDIYTDFTFYKSGVYYHVWGPTANKASGSHSVRLLGWGKQTCTDEKQAVHTNHFWIAANSWGNKWGDNGFFKIRKNVNEVGIEEDVVYGSIITSG